MSAGAGPAAKAVELLAHDPAAAARYLDGACRPRPRDAQLAVLHIVCLRRASRDGDAVAMVSTYRRFWPREPGLAFHAARLAESAGDRAGAITAYRDCVALDSRHIDAWTNLTALHAEAGEWPLAVEAGARATGLAPCSLPARINYASALAESRSFDAAASEFSAAWALDPHSPDIGLDLASTRLLAGDTLAAVAALRRVLERDPAYLPARSLLLLVLQHTTNDASGLAAAHRTYSDVAGCRERTPWRGSRAPAADRPLRVGLISGDFRVHSVWYFLAPLLEHGSAAGLEFYAYHTDRRSDAVTGLWRDRVARWRDVARATGDELAAAIAADDIDVLVNLGGHTSGGRPELMCRRLAPVQVSYLGYPAPLGIANVDFWICDAHVAPVAEAAPGDRDRPLRLPSSYFCYRPMSDADAVFPEERRLDDVVFGSFNVLAKLSAATVQLWSRALRAVPRATLVLKADGFGDSAGRGVLARFEAQGIAPSRIRTLPRCATRGEHLALYRMVDIALDTFPYNGATTTCEALWMGVPVVSLVGRTPASRMGASILRAAGCGEWASPDPDAWLDCVVGLAAQVSHLRAARSVLRERVLRSALTDEPAFVAAFAATLREAVRSAATADTSRAPR